MMLTCTCIHTQGIGSGRFILPPGVTLPAKLVPSARPKLLDITNTKVRSSTTLNSTPASYDYINTGTIYTSQPKVQSATSARQSPLSPPLIITQQTASIQLD